MTANYIHSPAIVLNKYKRHEDGRIIPINIYGSSAEQGTAIFVKPIHTLFDIGVDYKSISEIENTIDLIVISHEHSDHLNWHTLEHIIKRRPLIRIIMPEFVEIPIAYENLRSKIIVLANAMIENMIIRTGEEISVQGIETPHGAEKTMAYDVSFHGSRLLFSTDLSSTKTLPQKELFDLLMIETNYDEDEFVSKNGSGGAVNHLSVQEAISYGIPHLTDYGKLIPLHFGPTMLHYNQLHK